MSTKFGPFRSDEKKENRSARKHVDETTIPHERFQGEMRDYFERRRSRINVVKTTTTPRGQIIDWIPRESQMHGNISLPPPPLPRAEAAKDQARPSELAVPELAQPGIEGGPTGCVPILRKKLDALGYTKSLRTYLSKRRNQGGAPRPRWPSPEKGGSHRYASSGQSITCFGGSGELSCFDPYTETSDDFSLIQIGLSRTIDFSFLGIKFSFDQTVEAGWQEYRDLSGDWVPHLFLFYTTNGYAEQGDNEGGYNTDVDGWVQYDNVIFPGTTFTPYSERGGAQRKISIKYQLYQGNWWFACQGRWVGYYPATLFGGKGTLGDHADWVGFWGEIFDSDSVTGRTSSDMGSGYFPDTGWRFSAYMHNLAVQTDRSGAMADYDGSAGLWSSDPAMYDIEAHFKDDGTWRSYVYLGGPGAG